MGGRCVTNNGRLTFVSPGQPVVSDCLYNQPAGGLRDPACFGSAEVDGSGTIYFTWQDCRYRAIPPATFPCHTAPPFAGPNDLVFKTLDDNGDLMWSALNRIPIALAGSAVDAFLPGVAVDRGATGRLAVAFYYYPQWACGGESQPACRLSAAAITSSDGGASWSQPKTVIAAIQPRWLAESLACNGSCPNMVGDYISASFRPGDGKVYPVFATADPPTDGDCDPGSLGGNVECHEWMAAPTKGIPVG